MGLLDLGIDYVKRSEARLESIKVLLEKKSYADVVRECQEVVELLTKSILLYCGILPPKQHDISKQLMLSMDKLPKIVKRNIKKILRISKYLRKEREFSFYGEIDLIPSESYDKKQALSAIKDTNFIFKIVKKIYEK